MRRELDIAWRTADHPVGAYTTRSEAVAGRVRGDTIPDKCSDDDKRGLPSPTGCLVSEPTAHLWTRFPNSQEASVWLGTSRMVVALWAITGVPGLINQVPSLMGWVDLAKSTPFGVERGSLAPSAAAGCDLEEVRPRTGMDATTMTFAAVPLSG